MPCRHVIQRLIQRHGWSLLTEDELVVGALELAPENATLAQCEKAALACYAKAMYEACRQVADSDRRNQAYQELGRYLYRAAYKQWPGLPDDVVQDVTQRALALVFEQIDRCRTHAAFLVFALHKLRQAFTDEKRANPIEPLPMPDLAVPFSSHVSWQEAMNVLNDAIQRIPNEQQQKAIILKYFEELSDKEISKRLEIKEGHVRRLRNLGLARLRKDKVMRNYFAKGDG